MIPIKHNKTYLTRIEDSDPSATNSGRSIPVIAYRPTQYVKNHGKYQKIAENYKEHVNSISSQVLKLNIQTINKAFQENEKSFFSFSAVPLFKTTKRYVTPATSQSGISQLKKASFSSEALPTSTLIEELAKQFIPGKKTLRVQNPEILKDLNEFYYNVIVMKNEYEGGIIKRFFMSLFFKEEYTKTIQNFQSIIDKIDNMEIVRLNH